MLKWLIGLFYSREVTRRGVNIEILADTLAVHLNGFKQSEISEIARKCTDEGLELVITSFHSQTVIFKKPQPHNRQAYLDAIWRVVLPYLQNEDTE